MHRPSIYTMILLFCLGFDFCFIAQAQQKDQKQKAVSEDSVQTTPYDEELLSLSEILGSLTYLETLCPTRNHAAQPHKWRQLMLSLLQEENFDKVRTAGFFEAFNHAYRAYAQNYRRCTPMALTAQKFYQRKGILLIKELLRRYSANL